jgi:ABC-2 type transport system ATP-binding protein
VNAPAAAAAAVLQVRGLAFSYPGRHVFAGWQADFKPGITWVQGSNGSGKSTLLKLLAGALPPLAGALVVQGVDAATQPLDYRRRVFWCGPGAIAFDHLRPPEFFAFLRGLYVSFDDATANAQATALGLSPFLGKRLRELSTGTQRKVWLAAALAVRTPVVLLDEPLNALDAASVRHVRTQFMHCASDRACAWVIASHEPLGAAGDAAALLPLDAA